MKLLYLARITAQSLPDGKSRMKGFLVSTIRTSFALIIALVVCAVLYGVYSAGEAWWQKRGDVPYQQVKLWSNDPGAKAGFAVRAKTKFFDGQVLMIVTVMSSDSSKLPSFSELNVGFTDADGFEVFTKSFSRSEFTQLTDTFGQVNGLTIETGSALSREDYARFRELSTSWTPLFEAAPAEVALDPCESGISKGERLRRLRNFGSVTQKAENWYQAGGRSIHFLSGGELFSCE